MVRVHASLVALRLGTKSEAVRAAILRQDDVSQVVPECMDTTSAFWAE